MSYSDAELIKRTLDGDETAFGFLVDKYKGAVHALAYRKIGDFHTAEEITQDTFLKAYQKLRTLRDAKHLPGWLYVIAARCCIAWHRKNRLHFQPLDSVDKEHTNSLAWGKYADVRMREEVCDALESLPESDRTVLTLHYLSGLTCEEIAHFMGTSRSAVKIRLYRARLRLKKEMTTMMQETLGTFQLPPTLTQHIMEQIHRMKPTPAPSSKAAPWKPLTPWLALTTLVVAALLAGLGAMQPARFQLPYSLDGSKSAITVELMEEPFFEMPMSKRTIAKGSGRLNAGDTGFGNQTNDSALALASNWQKGEEMVNDKSGDTVGIATHDNQSVAMDSAGSFVAVWTDNRNVHRDIWMQRFDSAGNRIEGNQKVNGDSGTDDQNGGQVAMDKDGNFVVVWHDNRDGDYNIYAQRFNSSGKRTGSNFKINDEVGVAKQVSPSIAMDSKGNFVVAWIDGRDGGKDIYAQRFDDTVAPIGTNLRVNEDAYTITGNGYMDVSMSDAGLFGVTWATAQADTSCQLCVRFFNWAAGEFIAPTSVVTHEIDYQPEIGMDDAGISTIIWDYSGSVMGMRYDSSGNSITPTYIIDDSPQDAGLGWGSTHIAVRPSGEFVVLLTMYPGGIYHIRARRFDASSNPIRASFQVEKEPAFSNTIDITPEGQFVIVHNKPTGDLYVRRFDWSETPLGDSILLNDDGKYLSQARPKIAIATPETFMVVWSDARDKGTDSNFYGRIFQISGDSAVPVGEDFRIHGAGAPWESSVGLSSGVEGNPDISISGSDSGHFVIVWAGTHHGRLRGPWLQIHIRVYDVSGTLVASKVHYTTSNTYRHSVAANRSGCFVVAKSEALRKLGEGSERDIFLTFFEPDASVIGDTRVNPSDDNGATQDDPQVAMNEETIVVAWNEPRDGRDDVWARLYSFPDGIALTDEFRVHEDISQTGHYLVGVAIDDWGRFIITYNDRREGDWNVYARRFNSDFTPMGPDFKVNDDELVGVEQKGGDIVMTSPEDGDFAITWCDWRDGDPDVYVRLYDGDGNPKGKSYKISENDSSQQLVPAIAGSEDNIAVTWLDDRNGDWDVYARLSDSIPAEISVIAPLFDKEIANPGDKFMANIFGRLAEILHSFAFDLAFEPSVLRAVSVKEGAFLSRGGVDATLWQTPTIDNKNGIIRNIRCSRTQKEGVGKKGILATVTFEALKMGVTDLTLQNPRLLSPTGEDIKTSVKKGQIEVYPYGSISGVVLDVESKKPVRGAKVEVIKSNFAFGRKTYSADDGTYTINGVPVGDFDVTASKDDYLSETISTVHVEGGKTTKDININIEPFPMGPTITIPTSSVVGEIAPDISVKSLDGKTIKLSSFKGKVVILNFWATWVPECIIEMAVLEELYKTHTDALVVIGVSVDTDDQDAVKAYIENRKITYPIIMDANEILEAYDMAIGNLIDTIPTTIIVGKDGLIRRKRAGTQREKVLQRAYKSAMEGK